MELRYAIRYVADMDKAVAFHRDTLGLTLKFASPFWSEFDTGETVLALLASCAFPGLYPPVQVGGRLLVDGGVSADVPVLQAEALGARVSYVLPAATCDVAQSVSRGGLSDANYLCHLGPTLDGLGPAGANAHCSERSADGSKVPEFVETDSFVPKAAMNVAALLGMPGAGE